MLKDPDGWQELLRTIGRLTACGQPTRFEEIQEASSEFSADELRTALGRLHNYRLISVSVPAGTWRMTDSGRVLLGELACSSQGPRSRPSPLASRAQ